LESAANCSGVICARPSENAVNKRAQAKRSPRTILRLCPLACRAVGRACLRRARTDCRLLRPATSYRRVQPGPAFARRPYTTRITSRPTASM
jgi:hypothetical protein